MSSDNKIFARNAIINNQYQNPNIRYNREYLITQNVSKELNTYNYWGIFKAYNDVHQKNIDDKKDGYPEVFVDGAPPYQAPATRSLFNRAGAVMIGGNSAEATALLDENSTLDDKARIIRHKASEWRIYNNTPLIDSPENRKKQRAHGGCSVKELVQQSSKGLLGRAIYSYADFMYCKHLGRVPNNYLITLRRFPIPPGDNITSMGIGKTNLEEGQNRFTQHQGCLVTWLGTPGNEMENILKYSVTMPYKEMTAKLEDASTGSADGQTGVLNSIAAAFDPTYRQQYTSGYGGAAYNAWVGKFFGIPEKIDNGLGKIGIKTGDANGPYQLNFQDGNKVYGPVDRVKKIYMRSEEGIDFKQDITLTFEYELRSYNGINGRQAFLDLLANILNVTYTTGSFWGGGYRGGGMHQNSVFANLNIFKAKGGFTDFMDALGQDIDAGLTTAKNWWSGNSIQDIVKSIGQVLNGIGGMFLGGMLNKLGRPTRAYANSLLSEQPTGMWHVMIGNPNHPIMSMGNMVLKETSIQHYGPLGLDDFPTGLKVTCQLTRGKGRDNRNIELLYMHGNDRIYSSMSHRVMDMYRNAVIYNDLDHAEPTNLSTNNQSSTNTQVPEDQSNPNTRAEDTTATDIVSSEDSSNTQTDQTEGYKNLVVDAPPMYAINEDDLKNYRDKLMRFFGESDTFSIIVAASEQENGCNLNKPKPDPNNEGGNSTQKKA